MAASQQFSLRWNNYSQHIVTAFDDLRAGDELTDVTLSCDGQRIKAHKMLLSACSVYFRDTFRENPCKHPVIILKGVSFSDLKAVVAFMYNGQVNVTQERLPFFLQTAELLQIKGLTDMNEKEGSSTVNNRPQSSSSSTAAAHVNPSSLVNTSLDSSSMCETPENSNRPLTPKRKRFNVPNQNTIDSNAPTSSMGLMGFNQQNTGPVISGVGGSGVHGMNIGMGNGISMGGPSITSVTGNMGSSSSSHFNPHPVVIPPESNSSDNFPGGAMVKYEDEELPEDDDYDKNDVSEDNDNSVQDMLGTMDTSALGTYRTGGGAGPSSMVKDQTGTDSSSHGGWNEFQTSGNEFLSSLFPVSNSDGDIETISFTQTCKGQPKLILNGKPFYKHQTNGPTTTYWKCVNKRKYKCLGRVIQNGTNFTISRGHSCP